MSSLIDISLVILIGLTFLSSLYLLVLGTQKSRLELIYFALVTIIPFAVLLFYSTADEKLGRWSMYALIFPLPYLTIYKALKELKTNKVFSYLIFSLFTLVGLIYHFQYTEIYDFSNGMKEKGKYVVRAPGVANVIFSPKHPFITDVAKYYGEYYISDDTFVIASPIDMQEMAKAFHVKDKYNGINLLIEENEYEKVTGAKLTDLFLVDFQIKETTFHNFNGTNSFFGDNVNRLKVIFFVRKKK